MKDDLSVGGTLSEFARCSHCKKPFKPALQPVMLDRTDAEGVQRFYCSLQCFLRSKRWKWRQFLQRWRYNRRMTEMYEQSAQSASVHCVETDQKGKITRL